MEKSSYRLSKHTFFCLADNHYVFLDLRNDEYLCLGRKHTDAMKSLLNGQQGVDTRSAKMRLEEPEGSDPRAVVRALVKKGLLVENDADGKLPTPTRIAVPSASTLNGIDRRRPRIGPMHFLNFFVAAATASTNLRWRSIERTVQAIVTRKSTRTTAITAADISGIRDLFEIFHTLRPYYPRPYLCLFDSLALLHFLARYGLFPQWVYGVKLEPFAAHCWVQAGNSVVNDIIDNVRDYTPIMSV